jgi:hypothetical protein
MTRSEPKLAIDPVPEPLWGINLRAQLKTRKEWDEIRLPIFEQQSRRALFAVQIALPRDRRSATRCETVTIRLMFRHCDASIASAGSSPTSSIWDVPSG